MENMNEGSVTISLQSYDELKAIQREFEDRLKKNRDEVEQSAQKLAAVMTLVGVAVGFIFGMIVGFNLK